MNRIWSGTGFLFMDLIYMMFRNIMEGVNENIQKLIILQRNS
ncbi:hypothetical protein [Flavobacterium sp. CLA17]|nr:hypothetical protein [Flavobacterium sp. CLA17]